MMTPPPKRPVIAIQRLIDALTPFGETMDIPARKRIFWKKRGYSYLYLLVQGEISVLRLNDGLLLGTAKQPHIFGFSEYLVPTHSNFLRTETPCTIIRVKALQAIEEVEHQQLWRLVTELSMFHTSIMLYRDMQIVNQRAYTIIHYYLLEIDRLSFEKKHQVNILNKKKHLTEFKPTIIKNFFKT